MCRLLTCLRTLPQPVLAERKVVVPVRCPGLFRRMCSACWIAFPLLLCPAAYAGTANVVVVLSDNGGSYTEFSDALRKALAGSGITETVILAGAPLPASGMVIGVGMKAATAIAASRAKTVLNVLIPRAGYDKLLHDFRARAASDTYSAIFLDQPEHRQVDLIAAALPDKHRIGLLYSSPPEGLARLRLYLAHHNLALSEQKVDPEHPLSDALQDILDSSDVLLAMPDAEVYNASTIRNILLAAYRHGVPLVGFSPAYVNAGALCAVFSSPEQIAAQVADMIRQFADADTLPAAHYPYEFEVMVNEQVARSLGLQVKSAAVLQYELKSEIGGAP